MNQLSRCIHSRDVQSFVVVFQDVDFFLTEFFDGFQMFPTWPGYCQACRFDCCLRPFGQTYDTDKQLTTTMEQEHTPNGITIRVIFLREY